MWRSTLAVNAKAEANMHSSLKINLEGAAVTGASDGAGRGQLVKSRLPRWRLPGEPEAT